MHLSLIPPPHGNTKANTRLPCSNYTCAGARVGMWRPCASLRDLQMSNARWKTPLHLPLRAVTPLVFCTLMYTVAATAVWDAKSQIEEMHHDVKAVGVFEVDGDVGDG